MNRTDPESIPSDDRGLLLGDGLYETIRLYRGRAFRLAAHLTRLREGARELGVPVPHDLEERVGAAIASAEGQDAGLRLTLTRGSGDGLAPPELPRSRLIVRWRTWTDDPTVSRRGLRVQVRGRLDERALVTALKTLGSIERIQALRLARQDGADDALLRNHADRVVEGSSSNLLVFAGSGLLAPGPREGALRGITRAVLLEVAAELGIAMAERGPTADELLAAEEVVLSSSLRGVVPVVAVDGHEIGSGTPGELFRGLARGFRSKVERELSV